MPSSDSAGWSSPQDDDLLEAERFQAALEGQATSDPEMNRLADLANSLQRLEEPRDPGFAGRLREQLLTQADARPLSPTPDLPTTPSRHSAPRFAVAALTAALLLTLTTAGVANAARSAVPGSALYPVRTGMEDIQVEVNQNDSARGRTELNLAEIRIQEVQGLLKQVSAHTSTVLATLDAFTRLAASGTTNLLRTHHDTDSRDAILTIRAFVDNSLVALQQLASDEANDSVREKITETTAYLVEIASQAHSICSSCTPAPTNDGRTVSPPD